MPFCDGSEMGEFLDGWFVSELKSGAVLSASGRMGALISEDGEVVNLLIGNDRAGEQEEKTIGDSEEARGSDEPPPIRPRWGRQLFRHRCAVFGTSLLGCCATSIIN